MGTPDYIAPEVLLKKGYGMECDWYVLLIFVACFASAPSYLFLVRLYGRSLISFFCYQVVAWSNNVRDACGLSSFLFRGSYVYL